MAHPVFGTLTPMPAAGHPELLNPATHAAVLAHLPDALVAPIDPELADTAAMCAAYGVPPEVSANVVLIVGKRAGQTRQVACQVLATHRVDVNGRVRRALNVRKASFAAMAEAVAASGMAYGGITPVGLPGDWPVWVDGAVADCAWICLGSGVRESKLFMPGADLLKLPTAIRVAGLAHPAG